MLCLLFLLSSLHFSDSTFLATRNFYDGTLGYDGFVKGCDKEFNGSVPCNKVNLLNESWKYKLPISWIFTPDTNCLPMTPTCSDNVSHLYSTTYPSVLATHLYHFLVLFDFSFLFDFYFISSIKLYGGNTHLYFLFCRRNK